MPNNTFGYEPAPLPGHIARYDDYTAGQSVDYRPTPWDDFSQVNIETLWTWIQNDSDEKTRAVAEMWRRVGVLLESTRSNVERYATSLQQSWRSPAATEFLTRVGAALYSLDEWNRAAVTNTRALDTVAGKISSTQTAMRDIWQRFTVAAADAERRREEEKHDSVLMSIARGFTEDPPTHDEVRREFTDEAKPVMRALADTYTDSALALDRGTTFKGPTEARPYFDSAGPGGSAGSSSGFGAAAPAAPAAPVLPFPDGPGSGVPELAGMVPPAPGLPPPAAPPTPAVPVPPGAGLTPPVPGLPVPPPGAPRPPGAVTPPARTGLGTRVPSAPGQSSVVKAPPVSRPTLLGASGRPGTPNTVGAPPPNAPRRPTLHGARGAATAPARPPVPGAGVPTEAATTAARPLAGRHGAQPAGPVRGGTPGLGRSGRAGGAAGSGGASGATSPNLAGRRKPGTGGTPTARANPVRGGRAPTPQVLGGRTTPATTTVPGGAHGSQLAGRGGPGDRAPGAPRPAAQPQRAGDGRTGSGGAADEEMWAVDQAPSAVAAPAPQTSTNRRADRGRPE